MAFTKAIELVKGGFVRPGPTDTQFDATILDPFIAMAEAKYVRSAVGSDFYDALITNRTANVINYNPALGPLQNAFADADLEALFREGNLQQLFAYAIIHEALPNIHFKLSSSGVQVTQASFANPAGAQDMRYLADRYKENIRFLTEEVQSYLCKNKTAYIPFGFDADEFCDDCDVETKSKPSTLPIWY